jgi:hypothetical protein
METGSDSTDLQIVNGTESKMTLFQMQIVLIHIQVEGGKIYSTKSRLNVSIIVGRQNAKTVSGLVKNQ